jgi:aquaporin Z
MVPDTFFGRGILRAYVVELLGTFGLVFFAAGVVCVHWMTTPLDQNPGTAALLGLQPGLAGIALTQGLILAVLLSVTVPVSGGYLNPAVAIVLWLTGRLDTRRAPWLIGAQLLGSVLGALCLNYLFAGAVLRDARLGTPHLNTSVFPAPEGILPGGALVTGLLVELILTFFVVLAMFGIREEAPYAGLRSVTAGLAWTAAVFVGFPLTGAATNPARWFGPALMELALPAPRLGTPGPFSDAWVYTAGPILGAFLAGLVCFKLLPGNNDPPHAGRPVAAPGVRRPTA